MLMNEWTNLDVAQKTTFSANKIYHTEQRSIRNCMHIERTNIFSLAARLRFMAYGKGHTKTIDLRDQAVKSSLDTEK